MNKFAVRKTATVGGKCIGIKIGCFSFVFNYLSQPALMSNALFLLIYLIFKLLFSIFDCDYIISSASSILCL